VGGTRDAAYTVLTMSNPEPEPAPTAPMPAPATPAPAPPPQPVGQIPTPRENPLLVTPTEGDLGKAGRGPDRNAVTKRTRPPG